jgi:hypothetical protein
MKSSAVRREWTDYVHGGDSYPVPVPDLNPGHSEYEAKSVKYSTANFGPATETLNKLACCTFKIAALIFILIMKTHGKIKI